VVGAIVGTGLGVGAAAVVLLVGVAGDGGRRQRRQEGQQAGEADGSKDGKRGAKYLELLVKKNWGGSRVRLAWDSLSERMGRHDRALSESRIQFAFWLSAGLAGSPRQTTLHAEPKA
jgi:hypothetical protein